MAKIITVGTGTPTQRDYVNGFEYLTNGETILNRLEHFTMDEGRMRPTTPGGTTYRYEFDMKDHLGNTRMTLTDANNNGLFDNYAAEVLQADDYYPFGMRITRKLSASDNKYTYNGKEHENEFGLNWYHYGARYYDPAIGRWWAVDPVDEYNSPFSYATNSPIVGKDPDGRVVLFINGFHKSGDVGRKYWRNGDSAWDLAAMNKIGDNNARYYDGALGSYLSTFIRGGFLGEIRYLTGFITGIIDACEIYNGLARDSEGNVTESIKVVEHSMGAVFGRGMVAGIQLMAGLFGWKDLNIEFEASFAGYQNGEGSLVNSNVPLFEFMGELDWVAGSESTPGATQSVVIPKVGHSIFEFDPELLPSGVENP